MSFAEFFTEHDILINTSLYLFIEIGIIAVSYTHLDVYKRQVHNSREVDRLKTMGLITINREEFKKLRNAKVLLLSLIHI